MEPNPMMDGVTKVPIVYILKHSATGHFYVGSSGEFKDRKTLHLWKLKNGQHDNKRLQTLYNESSEVEFETFVCSDREAAYDQEQELINLHAENPLLLNYCRDVRAPMKGLKFSDEHRAGISEALKGRIMGDEWRAKLSQAKQGRTFSDSRKADMSAVRKGIPFSTEHRLAAQTASVEAVRRPVSINGVVYPSMTAARTTLNLNSKYLARRVHSDDPEFKDWFFVSKDEVVSVTSNQYRPLTDSIDHINIYSKGRTSLGRALTNFAMTPFKHPILGEFLSGEGLHYYLKVGEENKATGEVRRFDEFRQLWGIQAKHRGVELSRTHMVLNHDFDYHMRLGLIAKVTQNPKLFKMFMECDLPFTHYYYYGDPNSDKCKVVSPKRPGKLVTDLEEIREFLRKR